VPRIIKYYADNLQRVQDFYNELFGWQINQADKAYYMITTTEVGDYRMPEGPGAINGGMMKRSTPSESPVIVVNVSSIGDYLKKVESLGGRIVLQKMDIDKFGCYARVADSEGNVIGLWHSLEP
jgi:uncharacterized protein